MDFLGWFFKNFGLFFGLVFLVYIYLLIHRIVLLYDYLRHVPENSDATFSFIEPLFVRLEKTAADKNSDTAYVVDAIWAEIDCCIHVHFQAITGYVSILVLIGFAGTIFGSIGAFNEMFRGLATGKAAAEVFAASWNNGLSTALYTSLGAAVIGGVVLTIIGSGLVLTRAKRLEAMVSLKICEVLEGGSS